MVTRHTLTALIDMQDQRTTAETTGVDMMVDMTEIGEIIFLEVVESVLFRLLGTWVWMMYLRFSCFMFQREVCIGVRSLTTDRFWWLFWCVSEYSTKSLSWLGCFFFF